MKKTVLIATGPRALESLKSVAEKRGDASVECVSSFSTEDLERWKQEQPRIMLLYMGEKVGVDEAIILSDHQLPFHAMMALPFFFVGVGEVRKTLKDADRLEKLASSFSVIDYECLREEHRNDSVNKLLLHADRIVAGWVKEAIEARSEKKFARTRNGADAKRDYHTRFVDQRDVHLQYSLGMMYEEGNEVEQDFSQAFIHYQKAAELGLPAAQFALGCLYENGEGVERDFQKAFECYAKAAKEKYTEAYCALAQMYEEGLGTEQNIDEDFRWYKQAADKQIPHGMYKLACMYRDGKGTKQNFYRYRRLTYDAAFMGYGLAKEELRQMRMPESEESKGWRPGLGVQKEERWTKRLSVLIVEKGMSVPHFAKRVGIDFRSLENILKGKEEGTVSMLRAIRKAYPDVDLNWLVGE